MRMTYATSPRRESSRGMIFITGEDIASAGPRLPESERCGGRDIVPSPSRITIRPIRPVGDANFRSLVVTGDEPGEDYLVTRS